MTTTDQAYLNFDESKLASYLEKHILGFHGPIKADKFAGGQSNPTFLIHAKSGKYVLRRKPPGVLLNSAHAVDREYKVITALHNTTVPVAEAYHLCTDDSVIGSMFYIMEYVDGRIMWNPALPEFTANSRNAIYLEMSRVLASLHSIDVNEVGLSDYGKPGNYYERQISRWTKQYRASELESLHQMEALIKWLPANMPEDDGKVSLVHGDFRMDNLIFHKSDERVLAIVDWELSTLGHPYADLAYQCMQLRLDQSTSVLPGLGGLDRKALGILSEEEYVSQYCKNMGLSGIPNWNFYLIFSFFRLASIVQGVRKRAIEGNASNSKANETGNLIYPLLQKATELLEKS